MNKITKQQFLQARAGRQCKGRVLRLMKAFNTFEEFLAADKGKLMAAERQTRPDGKKGLGNKFFSDLDSVKATACEMELFQAQAKSRAEAAAKATAPRLFTVGQLKAVTTLMELCEIDKIDIEKIIAFLETMGANI